MQNSVQLAGGRSEISPAILQNLVVFFYGLFKNASSWLCTRKLWFFSLWGLSFLQCRSNVYQVSSFQETSTAAKIPGCVTEFCDQTYYLIITICRYKRNSSIEIKVCLKISCYPDQSQTYRNINSIYRSHFDFYCYFLNNFWQ